MGLEPRADYIEPTNPESADTNTIFGTARLDHGVRRPLPSQGALGSAQGTYPHA